MEQVRAEGEIATDSTDAADLPRLALEPLALEPHEEQQDARPETDVDTGAARSGSVGEPVDFFGLSRSELENLVVSDLKLPRFRAEQLFRWVYQKGVHDLAAMTDLPAVLRADLAPRLSLAPLPVLREDLSRDGTRKFLFAVPARKRLVFAAGEGAAGADSKYIESVLIKQPDRFTLCVSSQIGCGMACRFCRTATLGLQRNLTASEIVRQVAQVRQGADMRGEKFHNIVFMGMGEPLHNLDNVRRATTILTDELGLGLGTRRITISTVGLVPRIEEFFSSGVRARLAVSLNATTDEVRSKIMPINDRFPLETLLGTLRRAPLKPRDRITIEYVMLHGVNDTEEDLKRLPRILRGVRCKVNLIPYNENAGLGFRSPPQRWVEQWAERLRSCHVSTTIRWSKGLDIDAACGQLAAQQQSGAQ